METNNSSDTALFILCCAVFGFLVILGGVLYFSERFRDIRYVKMEMNRAFDDDEYRYWRRELQTLLWCLIPGLNPDRINGIRKFFKRGKHYKQTEKGNLLLMLLPSLLGVGICAACLAGGTFAWFTTSQATSTQTIFTANYDITTVVRLGEDELTAVDGIYTLEANKYYTVNIEASGSATTGYCIVDLGGEKLHTEQIPTNSDASRNSIEFTVHPPEKSTMQIIAQWGSSAKDAIIKNGSAYPNNDADKTPNAVAEQTETDSIHTVKSGDTLSGIASKYNTTVEKLKSYNGLTGSIIQIGNKLRIPPSDY